MILKDGSKDIMKSIKNKLFFFTKISLIKYIYLNYLCRNVVRNGSGKIIPYKNSCIELGKSSKITLYDGSVEIGRGKIKGSKKETYLRLRENAVWIVHESCDISYGCTIEILANAIFETYYFTTNCNTTIISKKKIYIGHDVMIGRNVIIYDSDFHNIYRENSLINKSEEIKINNHVWIATNSVVLKGVEIGEGAVIGANTIVTNDVNEKNLVLSQYKKQVLNTDIRWER